MKTKIWAHRGASGYAPENTLEAFELAIHQNADGIELDIQLTKDGELVVAHDEKIDRVTDGTGWIKNYTLKELKQFRFNRTHPEFTNACIPTLKEVYELMQPTNLTVNVELKTSICFYPGIEEKALKLAKDMQMEEQIIYSSFNHYTLKTLIELDSSVRTGLLYEDGWINVPAYGNNIGVNALHPATYLLQYPDFLKDCKKYNLPLHVWTVNTKEHMEKLMNLGVDAIITDFPDIARKISNISNI